MAFVCNKFKVGDIVIKSIFVFVMDEHIGRNKTVCLFPDGAVFENIFSIDFNTTVAVFGYRPGTYRRAIATPDALNRIARAHFFPHHLPSKPHMSSFFRSCWQS